MFSLLTQLELLIFSVFLYSSMIASNNDVLKDLIDECSFNVLDVLILWTYKNLVFWFWTWLIIFFRFSFLVSHVDIFDMSFFMFQNLQFLYFAAEMLMTPFYVIYQSSLIFWCWLRITWLFSIVYPTWFLMQMFLNWLLSFPNSFLWFCLFSSLQYFVTF